MKPFFFLLVFFFSPFLLFSQNENGQKAKDFYDKKKYFSALNLYQKSLKKQENTTIHYNLANTHTKIFTQNRALKSSQHLAHAIFHFERALELDPKNKKAQKNLLEIKKYTHLAEYKTFQEQPNILIAFLGNEKKIRLWRIFFIILAAIFFSTSFFFSKKKEIFRLWTFIFLGNYALILGAHHLIKKYPSKTSHFAIIAQNNVELYESETQEGQAIVLPAGLKVKIIQETEQAFQVRFLRLIAKQWQPFVGWVEKKKTLPLKR